MKSVEAMIVWTPNRDIWENTLTAGQLEVNLTQRLGASC